MSKIINTFSTILNYEKNRKQIEETLERYSQNGYKLVSTEISDKDYVKILYLFFVKEVDNASINSPLK